MVVRLLTAAFFLLMVGCVTPDMLQWPTNEPLPYSQGEFAGVHIGHTPEDVLKLLGQPHLKVQDDSLWI